MHGAVFAIMVQGFWTTGAIAVQTCQVITFESRCRIFIEGHWCSIAVQVWSKPVPNPGAEIYWRADARIRV
jgi:hypothetical protein